MSDLHPSFVTLVNKNIQYENIYTPLYEMVIRIGKKKPAGNVPVGVLARIYTNSDS